MVVRSGHYVKSIQRRAVFAHKPLEGSLGLLADRLGKGDSPLLQQYSTYLVTHSLPLSMRLKTARDRAGRQRPPSW